MEEQKPNTPKGAAAEPQPPRNPGAKPAAKFATPARPAGPAAPGPVAPLFRPIDWITFIVTCLVVFTGYYITLAPDCGLEDAGELAVASYYAGVPHPPGYPVWTVYTWLFTVLLPVSNIAFRVAVGEALAGAVACGLVGLMVSRGSSLLIEGFEELKNLDRKWEKALCLVTGYVAAMLMGFNGFMWSQSIIVEVYAMSACTLAIVLVLLMRWMYAPHHLRYLYLAFFMFGICTTTHQTLILAAVGFEIAVAAANPRLGRDLFLINGIVYILALILKTKGVITTFNNPVDPSRPTVIFIIFNFIGLLSIVLFAWLTIQTRKVMSEWKSVLVGTIAFCIGAGFYLYMPVASMTNPPLNWGYPRTVEGFKHALTRGQYERVNPTDIANDPGRFLQQIAGYGQGAVDEFTLVYLALALLPFIYLGVRIWREGGKSIMLWIGSSSALVMILFTGMLLAQKAGLKGMLWPLFIFTCGALLVDCVLIIVAIYRHMQKPERAFLVGVSAVFLCLSLLLLIMLNPSPDRASQGLNRVFFTSSHALISMFIGLGLSLLGASLINFYNKFRVPTLVFCAISSAIALYVVTVTYSDTATFDPLKESPLLDLSPSQDPLVRFTSIFSLSLACFATCIFALARQSAPMIAFLAVLVIMPFKSVLSHWADNEQRGHLFGYWFGHDMFTPPFKNDKGQWSYDPTERKQMLAKGANIYPEMDRDTVLFGGTDPGRFNPTYMIFCESFIPANCKPRDPFFDRRDVYLITQNALADGTYLNYIRAHYNRSTQIDPPFFQELLHSRAVKPLDTLFTGIGDAVEKYRRAGSSFFKESDFTDLAGLKAKLNQAQPTPLVKYLRENFSSDTQAKLAGADEKGLRNALIKDLNVLLEKGALYDAARFQGVKLTDRTLKYAAQNPLSHTRIRLNRQLLEEAFPKEIAVSIGGVYPDREIITPSPEDSQKSFQEYMDDAQKRMAAGQLRPGEDVRVDNGRVQVSGQVAVMAINALLTKVIFDKNPDHAFYVEESFPLDWMYPYLTPFGVIMKINRNPLPELPQDVIDRDHKFWSEYSDRAVGNWITYDTPVSNICAFAERVYMHRDYKGFTGDTKFIRDDDAQKAFSKLRSSIGGVYNWRVANARSADERNRMIKEAEFAFKQSLAFCPFSPEAVFRYVNLILGMNQPARIDDALLVAETCKKLDPFNAQVEDLVHRLRQIKQDSAGMVKAQGQISTLQREHLAEPSNAAKAFALAQSYVAMQNTNGAMQTLESLLSQPGVESSVIISIAKAFVDFNQIPRLEKALLKLTEVTPDSPEAWYDLAGVQAILGRPTAVENLRKALVMGAARNKKDPKANNLAESALKDVRFNSLRANPEFQKLMDVK